MPPPTNIIQNGTFDLQGMFWGGTDIETTFTEGAYLGNGSQNRVAEIDGNVGQRTVMAQTFTIEAPIETELTFVAALRTQSTTVGQDGFTVEIVNSTGGVVATLTVMPTVKGVYTTYTLPVNFTTAGSYTLRFTELGPDNSFGAIVDNISLLVCFAGQTLIDTPGGAKPARDIRIGDPVTTEHGPMPVRWIGRRHVSADEMSANDKLRPVKISVGALGQGLPRADLWVSRQHRMLVSSPICQRMFGRTDTLISALKLTALPGIHIDQTVAEIDYIHLLFDQHEVVFAEGAPSESLLLQSQSLAALSPETVDELRILFPELAQAGQYGADARLIPKGHQQARLADRMVQNDRAPLEAFRRTSA